ncbi:MAG: hypothetical protein MJZ37_08450 [Bacilli bacterium]|nr:hypothetical protein [Bacilli bacterium]
MKHFNSANVAAVVNLMIKNARGTTTTDDGAAGEGLIVKEDLSNFIDAGKLLTNDITMANFRNIITGMLEGVGTILYENAKVVSPSRFDLMVDTSEFLTAVEKVRISSIDFEQSYKYAKTGGSSFSDMFDNHPLTFSVTVWNSIASFRTKPYTISYDQLRSSVANQAELTRLIGQIYAVVEATYYTALRELEKRIVMAQMANACLYRNGVNVIDVLQAFKAQTNVTLTPKTMHESDAFKRWIYGFIKHLRLLMSEPSPDYNTAKNVIETEGDDFRGFILEPYYTSIRTISKQEDMADLKDAFDGFKEIAYIQNKHEYNKIDVEPIDPPVVTPGKHVVGVTVNDIFGMIWDKRGTLMSSPGIETGTQHNDFDKHDNYVHLFDVREMCDRGSNAVLLVAHDATANPSDPTTLSYIFAEESDA